MAGGVGGGGGERSCLGPSRLALGAGFDRGLWRLIGWRVEEGNEIRRSRGGLSGLQRNERWHGRLCGCLTRRVGLLGRRLFLVTDPLGGIGGGGLLGFVIGEHDEHRHPAFVSLAPRRRRPAAEKHGQDPEHRMEHDRQRHAFFQCPRLEPAGAD